MNRQRFEAWLCNIYETRDVEISCTECFDLVSGFVEIQVAGQDAAAASAPVKQHLDQCRACREEYEVLHDLIRRENQGDMPELEDLLESIP